MVKDQITDGKRIAQLLASELSGVETGGLSTVRVTDADENATPTPTGTLAYRITADDSEIAAVSLYPDHAELAFEISLPELEIELPVDGEPPTVRIPSGAAVKSAVDLVREAVEQRAHEDEEGGG